MVSGAPPLAGSRREDALAVASRRFRVLGITLVFAAVGPPVGTVIFLWPITFTGSRDDIAVLIMSFFLGYITGGIPAVIAGLTIGFKHVYLRGARWWFALGVGVLVGIAFEVSYRAVSVPAGPVDVRLGTYCAVAMISTFVCWMIVRRWFSDREAAP